ncbi:fluoride efflux transporter CrcB [Ramlibacter sp. AN1015]|uniref:fluoride efflux transporter CrcB n=1 Tax=Ramlibacter sp. AN1015 TaxID=3133428 RepID=UPI0030C17768
MGSALAVASGAAIGALLRWRLNIWLNPSSALVSVGTLAANLLGAYLIGLALAWFAQRPDLSPQLRLLVVTGFLGGLTTFSTFSAEVVQQLQEGRPGAALTATALHVAGSLALTWLGIATFGWLRRVGGAG